VTLGNRLNDFFFTIGAIVVSIFGRSDLLSDNSIYGRFLNGSTKPNGEHDHESDYYKREQTPVHGDVKYKEEVLKLYQYDSQPD
jgi:hypothetical protein